MDGRIVSELDGFAYSTHDTGSPLLVVLADGLGGHPAGHVASRLAVDTLLADCPGGRTNLSSPSTTPTTSSNEP